MGGMGRGGNSRAAPDNRVIFTRDLGGDFAREENAAFLFRSGRLFLFSLSFQPPRSLENLLPFYLRREIRPVGAFNVATRLLFPTSLLFRSGEASRQIATPLHVSPFRNNVCSHLDASHVTRYVTFGYAIEAI